MFVCVYVCVCLCVRETFREREMAVKESGGRVGWGGESLLKACL